jgi:hypothetical protein
VAKFKYLGSNINRSKLYSHRDWEQTKFGEWLLPSSSGSCHPTCCPGM